MFRRPLAVIRGLPPNPVTLPAGLAGTILPQSRHHSIASFLPVFLLVICGLLPTTPFVFLPVIRGLPLTTHSLVTANHLFVGSPLVIRGSPPTTHSLVTANQLFAGFFCGSFAGRRRPLIRWLAGCHSQVFY